MKKKVIPVSIAVMIFTIFSKNIIITSVSHPVSAVCGIIDGAISDNHQNIVETNVTTLSVGSEQHGDKVINFMDSIAPSCTFYYYNAEIDGKITTASLISGLQWMKDNNVERVAISLSSRYYSEELEAWIEDNSSEIKIYASYSNVANSFDYPAQYDGVIGVGTNDVLTKKENDILYKSCDIIAFTLKPGIYSGNSYLTPYAMLTSD